MLGKVRRIGQRLIKHLKKKTKKIIARNALWISGPLLLG